MSKRRDLTPPTVLENADDTRRLMPARAIRKVLVANRGEIARRIFRTLRRMGIASVAVYSDADARSPPVGDADEAVRIGPPASLESYLDIDRVLAAAAAVGAGIAVAVDQATHHAEIGALGAGLAVALPVAIFLVVLGGLYQRARARTRLETLLFVAAPVLVLLSAALNQTVLLVGLLLAALVAIKQVIRHQAGVA
jgi:hypothetical protein